MPEPIKLPQHAVTTISVLSDADPRSVRKRLINQPVRGMAAARIDAVLKKVRPSEPGWEDRLRTEVQGDSEVQPFTRTQEAQSELSTLIQRCRERHTLSAKELVQLLACELNERTKELL